MNRDEDVRGTIVGSTYLSAQIYYDGRPQGPQISGDSTEELKQKAKQYVADQKTRLGSTYNKIFSDSTKWELRVLEKIDKTGKTDKINEDIYTETDVLNIVEYVVNKLKENKTKSF